MKKYINISLASLAILSVSQAEINFGFEGSLGSNTSEIDKQTTSPREWSQSGKGELSYTGKGWIEYSKDKSRYKHRVGIDVSHYKSSGVITVEGSESANDSFNEENFLTESSAFYRPEYDLGRGFKIYTNIQAGIIDGELGGDVFWDNLGVKTHEVQMESLTGNLISATVGAEVPLGEETSISFEYGVTDYNSLVSTVDFSSSVSESSIKLSRGGESSKFSTKLKHSIAEGFSIFGTYEEIDTIFDSSEEKTITVNGSEQSFQLEETEIGSQTFKIGLSLKI